MRAAHGFAAPLQVQARAGGAARDGDYVRARSSRHPPFLAVLKRRLQKYERRFNN
jgi:hypothetical protein